MKQNNVEGPALLADYVNGRLSRGQLLKAVAAGITVAALPQAAHADTTSVPAATSFPFFPQVQTGRYSTETRYDIVSNLLTLEVIDAALGRALLTTPAAVTAAGVTGLLLSAVQAVVGAAQYRIDFWSSIFPGITETTRTFNVDQSLVSSPEKFLRTIEILATIRTAAAITAVREFAELGEPTLAKYASQMLGSYAEERGVMRTLGAQLGITTDTPPNNKAFETDLFLYTRDAIDAYRTLGLIGGTGVEVQYRGRDVALAAAGAGGAAVIQRTPNSATSSPTFTGAASFTEERH